MPASAFIAAEAVICVADRDRFMDRNAAQMTVRFFNAFYGKIFDGG